MSFAALPTAKQVVKKAIMDAVAVITIAPIQSRPLASSLAIDGPDDDAGLSGMK
jgi:hypothetical protein